MASSSKRSILITGCSPGGVGHALALEFASHGMRVFATARSTSSLSRLSEKGIEICELDVTNAESITALRDEISKRTGGKLDMLFNNAGSMYEAPAIEADPARIRAVFDTNVFGLFNMVSAFTPLLFASSTQSDMMPVIINTSSVLARLPFAFSAAYNASKAAVASYSDTLRIELDPLGIKVVTLFMGEVSTNLMSPDNICFDPEGIYTVALEGTRERSQNHAKKSMKPELFAKQVVQAILAKHSEYGKGEFLWKGTNAWAIWFLNLVGWRYMLDNVVKKMVGLEKKKSESPFAKKQQFCGQRKMCREANS
ncbi:hypothetical protein N7532_003729 [Penicillium argentinense]|uniref:NADPH-dependent 1-acyldihydroxyacetone phosphate reductase n=1 Tax=Penicillium argentinense TaxID=1131581 RepID=A0A9W9KE55_9EURO|nr:uncharacterized protein N7532_003729 [Penicillium argentinense]KAJ5103200.1 hypothetical protein N7532_003729 [Penicillium argentinense]